MNKKLHQTRTAPIIGGLVTKFSDKTLRGKESFKILLTVLLVLPCSNGSTASEEGVGALDSSSSPRERQESWSQRQLQVTPGGIVRGGLSAESQQENRR